MSDDNIKPVKPLPSEDDQVYTLTGLRLCGRCLNGEGGQCHTPGCSLIYRRAPDVPIWWQHLSDWEGVEVRNQFGTLMRPDLKDVIDE